MAQLSAVAESARRCARSANRSRCNGRGGSAGISHRRAWPFAAGAGKRLDSMTAIRNINATTATARTVRPIRTSIHQFDTALGGGFGGDPFLTLLSPVSPVDLLVRMQRDDETRSRHF